MKNLKVTLDQEFGFTCDSADLVKTVSKAELVTSKLSSSTEFEKRHVIFAYDGNLYVLGYSSDTFIVLRVANATADEDGAFGYTPKVLTSVIKNRNAMTFKLERNRLTFTALKGRYTGSIETVEVSRDQVPFMERNMQERSGEHLPVSASMMSSVREGFNIVDLKDHYNKEKILCGVRVKSGVLEMSSYDNYHMAYYKTKVDSDEEFILALPVETFKLLDKFIAEEEEPSSKFHMTSKEFRVTSRSFIVVLPPVQVDDSFYDAVPGYIQGLKEPVAEVPFTQLAMRTANNMFDLFTLANEDTRLSLSIQNTGRVGLSLITEQGKISDTFKFKNVMCSVPEMMIQIDPRIFDDLFKKVSTREVVKARFYEQKNRGCSSSFMLSASTEKVKAYLIGTYHEEKEK